MDARPFIKGLSYVPVCPELWILFHTSETEVKQIHHLGGDGSLTGLYVLALPLACPSNAAGEDLSVDGRRCRVGSLLLQKRGEGNGDLIYGVCYDGLEGLASDSSWRLMGGQMESVGVLLDEAEKDDDDSFKGCSRAAFGTHLGPQNAGKSLYFTVDDNPVETLPSSEMLVDNGLGGTCHTRDFFDRDGIIASSSKGLAGYADQLFTVLGLRHPHVLG